MQCQLGITSLSLGRCFAGHHLSYKLYLANAYGYKGIELCYEDLLDVAQQESNSTSIDAQLHAAETIRRMCDAYQITIINLQPMANYEGLLNREEHEIQIEKLKLWLQLAKALGTDMLQIPSSYVPEQDITEDYDLIVQDLQEAADLGLAQQPPIRFVYEALSWGTRCDTWERSWEIVQAVDRPNFGLCLDTFNIAGRIFADPAAVSGRTQNYHTVVQQSIKRLLRDVDISKVFYVQVVDAERLDAPLVKGHPFYDEAQPKRMSWSRNCRLFYGEQERGGYLPILQLCKAIFQGLGFKGWVSLEVFHRHLADTDFGVPEEFARRGARSWALLNAHLNNGSVATLDAVHKRQSSSL